MALLLNYVQEDTGQEVNYWRIAGYAIDVRYQATEAANPVFLTHTDIGTNLRFAGSFTYYKG